MFVAARALSLSPTIPADYPYRRRRTSISLYYKTSLIRWRTFTYTAAYYLPLTCGRERPRHFGPSVFDLLAVLLVVLFVGNRFSDRGILMSYYLLVYTIFLMSYYMLTSPGKSLTGAYPSVDLPESLTRCLFHGLRDPRAPGIRYFNPENATKDLDYPSVDLPEEFNEVLIPPFKRPPYGYFNPENATKDPLDPGWLPYRTRRSPGYWEKDNRSLKPYAEEISNFSEADRKFLEIAFTYLKTYPELFANEGLSTEAGTPRTPVKKPNMSSPINPTDAGLGVKPKTVTNRWCDLKKKLFANEGLSAEAGAPRTPVKKKAEPEDENSDVY
ncbi:hypothetical protein QBC39DRAFT_329598 [Podospora conica]|nr:hypothetical protein QBC39DRAFT_329598 [Schizothecium conicum]